MVTTKPSISSNKRYLVEQVLYFVTRNQLNCPYFVAKK